MDIHSISSLPQGTSFTGHSLVGARPAAAPAAATAHPATPAIPSANNAEAAKYEAAMRAAQEAIKINYYPVSDVRFTIYKDPVGDYVTRVTSLKDGKVTYYAEKDVYDMLKLRQAEEASFHTEA